METSENTKNELTALQNFENSLNKDFNTNLKVKLYFEEDKRKKTKFVLTNNDIFISPKLNYDKMNHLLLGIYNCKKHNI